MRKDNALANELWLAACLHIGERAHDRVLLNQYLKWAGKTGADILIMGDALDTGLCLGTKHIGSIWQNDRTPQQQIDDFCGLFNPLKRQILGILGGNHELRAERVTSINPLYQSAQRLGVPYWGASKIFRWNKKIIFASHGATTAPLTDFNKVLHAYEGLDAICLAHTHALLHHSLRRFVAFPDGTVKDKRILFVRSGNFLKDAEYARYALHAPTDTGSAILEFKDNSKLGVRLGL